MTLLEKFDAVKLSDEDQIPAADKEWCEKEQTDFNNTIEQLSEKEQYFEEQLAIEIQINKCYNVYRPGETSSLEPWVTKSWKDKKDFKNSEGNYYDFYKFTSAYPIVQIQKLRKACKINFVRNVTLYFVEKYNLDVPEYHKVEDQIDEHCDYKVILKLIKEHLGGFLDFKGSAIEQAVIEIKSEFKYNTPKAENSIITFDRFLYKSRGDAHEYPNLHNSYDIRKWQALDKAFSIFETEEVRSNYAIMYLCGKSAGEWDVPLNGEKIDSFKYFKNGKFQIKFKETSFANAFIQRFNFKK